MASSFAILCLTVCTILGPSALADDFKSHAVLDPNGNFQIYWNYDKDSITIKYEGMSKGWIGLGFSPNGAMTGADIAVFWVDTSGKGYVSVSPEESGVCIWYAPSIFRIGTLPKMGFHPKTRTRITPCSATRRMTPILL